jgi:hypothetical protein
MVSFISGSSALVIVIRSLANLARYASMVGSREKVKAQSKEDHHGFHGLHG